MNSNRLYWRYVWRLPPVLKIAGLLGPLLILVTITNLTRAIWDLPMSLRLGLFAIPLISPGTWYAFRWERRDAFARRGLDTWKGQLGVITLLSLIPLALLLLSPVGYEREISSTFIGGAFVVEMLIFVSGYAYFDV